jgi:propanol-preferring alcohol dehydrogenase
VPLPEGYPDLHAAPLLCAGAIGYRTLAMTGEAQRLGLYRFGSSAHIVAQVARFQGRRVSRSRAETTLARTRHAEWAGDSLARPPEELDAAILFALASELMPAALRALARGGTVVCAGIHMSAIPSFPLRDLLGRAHGPLHGHLTRRSCPRWPCACRVRTEVHPYVLQDAGRALEDLRAGRFQGTAVIKSEHQPHKSITRRYDELAHALDEQLGLQPTRETRVTYRQILGQT